MTELGARVAEIPVIGVIRRCPPKQILKVIEGAVAAGLRVFEITADSEAAARQISTVREAFADTLVGAGTVTDPSQLEEVLKHGAAFVVTPVFVDEVLRACLQNSVPCLPGAATPTEIWHAAGLGAEGVKVFPASHLGGPKYLSALREPLGGVRLVPTGGVTKHNAKAYIEAGAWAVGVGSAIFAGRWLERGDVEAVRGATSALLASIR